MAQQGQYPLGNRSLQTTDTVTGVASGQTADIPLSTLSAFIIGGGSNTSSGPTANRPTPSFIGQSYFDTDLGFMVWAKQIFPAIWVNAAGVQV
jgi:hypothetical protein